MEKELEKELRNLVELHSNESGEVKFRYVKEAKAAMDSIASRINQVRKQQEMVDKVQQGNTNISHGITKKFNRTAQQVEIYLIGFR